jgi:hypothetical protein
MHLHIGTLEEESSPEDDAPPTLEGQNALLPPHSGGNETQDSDDEPSASSGADVHSTKTELANETKLVPLKRPSNPKPSEGEYITPSPLAHWSTKPKVEIQSVPASPRSSGRPRTSEGELSTSIINVSASTWTLSLLCQPSPSLPRHFLEVLAPLSFNPNQRRSSLPTICGYCRGAHATTQCPHKPKKAGPSESRRSSVHALPEGLKVRGSVSV